MGGTDRAHELGAFLAGLPFFASFDESTLVWLAGQFEPTRGGGTVVAVDISPAVEPMTVAPFGPGLSGWQVLAGRLNPLSPPRPVPSVFDIVSRATGLPGTRPRRWRIPVSPAVSAEVPLRAVKPFIPNGPVTSPRR